MKPLAVLIKRTKFIASQAAQDGPHQEQLSQDADLLLKV